MGAKGLIYIYLEKSLKGPFSAMKRPAVLSDALSEFKKNNYIEFKKAGGIKIVDYMASSETHVRITFWNTADGYNNWLKGLQSSKYLLERDLYQKKNFIESTLIGPHEVTEYD